jgi:hypothetical protein
MGCWNETCAFSRMAIHAGEAVRFMAIGLNRYHYEKQEGFEDNQPRVLLKGSSGCYIGDLWSIVSLPIRGKYNDYGTIENIPDKTERDKAEIDLFVKVFKTNGARLKVGDNEYHDIATNDFELDDILGCLQEGRVCFKQEDVYNDHVPIGWIMVKESVWQSLLKTDITKSGEWYEKKKYSSATIKVDLEKAYKKIKDSNDLISKYELKYGDTRSWVWHMTPYDNPLELLSENQDKLFDSLSELEYIYSLLGLLRITIHPTTGSGSQNRNEDLWITVNKSWTKLAKDKIDKDKKDEEAWEKDYAEILKKKKS